MQVNFQILRQAVGEVSHVETYLLEVEPGNTILDCLNRIKWELDGSLTFRRNCRNMICGSCGMRINGRSTLACKENIGQEIARFFHNLQDGEIPTMTIAPLGNLPVLRDLVVDMKPFWGKLEAVEPYISSAARVIPEREFLQTPDERSKLNQVGNCIMCGACYSECNALTVNPGFVGPHALAKTYRMVTDGRDDDTEARLENANTGTEGVWGCTRCGQCNASCPMDVEPLTQISHIKGEILDRHDDQKSRAIRHRKQLIELVKEGGWIDERKFGIQVVGNGFKDLAGMASLAPLGWKMLTKGKFPMSFEASEGAAEVRSLIEAVQQVESPSKLPSKLPSTETPFEAKS
jgi:succinate dehydrogenase / fumarate reductase, iron-sulfur subunit